MEHKKITQKLRKKSSEELFHLFQKEIKNKFTKSAENGKVIRTSSLVDLSWRGGVAGEA